MKRETFIETYVPCSEAQRAKIEAIRNKSRMNAYFDRRKYWLLNKYSGLGASDSVL